MKQPNPSIVIPVLNGARHINNLMNSLINLDYSKNKCEILIVDNEFKDKTEELVRNSQKTYPQIKLYFEKRKIMQKRILCPKRTR